MIRRSLGKSTKCLMINVARRINKTIMTGVSTSAHIARSPHTATPSVFWLEIVFIDELLHVYQSRIASRLTIKEANNVSTLRTLPIVRKYPNVYLTMKMPD